MTLNPSPFNSIHRLAGSLHDHMAGYGYQPVDIPIIDSADLFLTRAGDQVINKLFTFERHGQQLALRPEFTAAAAHYYAQQSAATIARWQFYGAIFEDDPETFTHDYQRLSIGAELIGMRGPVTDAEVIGMAVQGIMLQGIEDWRLEIGHIGLMRRLLARFQLDSRTERFLINHIAEIRNDADNVLDRFDRALLGDTSLVDDRLEADSVTLETTSQNTHQMLDVLLDSTQRGMTMGGRTRQDIARRLFEKRQRMTDRQQVVAAIQLLAQWVELASAPATAFTDIQKLVSTPEQPLFDEWRETLALIEAYGIDLNRITIRPDLARNWDYYTGIVFEIHTDSGKHLGGGGRYDELVSLVSDDETVPAIGFAYFLDPILACTPDTRAAIRKPIQIILDANNSQAASMLAHTLRASELIAVLLPEHEANQHQIQMRVSPDGIVLFDEASYDLQDIDQLTTTVKRALHDQSSNHRTPQ